MNAWAVIQALLIAVLGFWTYYWTTHLGPPVTFPWWAIVLYLIVPLFLMPLIVAASIAGGQLQLRRPSWRRNPFVGSDILQNTHIAGYGCLACGVFWLFHTITAWEHSSFSRAPLPVALFAAGIACLLSIRVCLILFRNHIKT